MANRNEPERIPAAEGRFRGAKILNINFPELEFTSPGTYKYTVKELTPSDEYWLTDDRVYRVIITVTRNPDGTLTATEDYPDGKPKFVNMHCPPEPEPPSEICKCFEKLPFPMFLFLPPQKPEFMELTQRTPNVFDWWEGLFKRRHG